MNVIAKKDFWLRRNWELGLAQTIDLEVLAQEPDTLRIIGYELKKGTTTYYFDFVWEIDDIYSPDDTEISVPMPIAPQKLILEIQSKSGTTKLKDVKFSSLDSIPLDIKKDKPKVESFIQNIFDFCRKASYLECGVYEGKHFKIHYVPQIIDTDKPNMPVLKTPASIFLKDTMLRYEGKQLAMQNGDIEVSKDYFLNMTVPMRVFILLHEYGHHYFGIDSRDLANEEVCDSFAVMTFLALGFPPLEVMNALDNDVLRDTPANRKRLEEAMEIILNTCSELDECYK